MRASYLRCLLVALSLPFLGHTARGETRVLATAADFPTSFTVGHATINNTGVSAFIADRVGLISADHLGGFTPLVNEGDLVAGINTPILTRVTDNSPRVWLNETGDVTAGLAFSAAGLLRGAIWSSSSGGRVVAFDGQAIEGQPDVALDLPFQGYGLQVNPTGQVVGHSSVRDVGGALTGAIWTTSDTGVRIVAREGDLVANGRLANLSTIPAITDTGRIVFRADLLDAGGANAGQGVFSWNDGVLTQTFGALSPIPGVAGSSFVRFGDPVATGEDRIALRATVLTPNVFGIATVAENVGGGFRLVGLRGDPTPGIPGGSFGTVSIGSGEDGLVANDVGLVAFPAFTDAAVDSGFQLWSEGGVDGLHLVETDSTPAPETNPSLSFALTTAFRALDGPASLNNAGQLAFHSFLVTGTGTFAGQGWFAEDAGGQLRKIAQIGDTVEWNGQDWTILDLSSNSADPSISGSDDPSIFNDNGVLIFRATLGRGAAQVSAILVSDTVAVPEVNGLVLAGVLLVGMAAVRRRPAR